MKFYISFKDSKHDIFRTIRIWSSELHIESILKQLAINNYCKDLIKKIEYDSQDPFFTISIFGENEMKLGCVIAQAA